MAERRADRADHANLPDPMGFGEYVNTHTPFTSFVNDPSRSRELHPFHPNDSIVYPSPTLREVSIESCKPYMKTIAAVYAAYEGYRPGSIRELASSRAGQNGTRADETEADELSTIPEFYFEDGFDLTVPSMFTKACGVYTAATMAQAPHVAMALQEKLSHYLDIIEIKLLRRISSRSESFFDALLHIQELQAEVRKASACARSVRAQVGSLSSSVTGGGLHIVSLSSHQKNAQATLHILRLMKTVQETQANIQLLLTNSEFVSALQLVRSTQELLGTELAGVLSLRHLSAQLSEMESLIHRMVAADIESLVLFGHPAATEPSVWETVSALYNEGGNMNPVINAEHAASLVSILNDKNTGADGLLSIITSFSNQVPVQLSKQTKAVTLATLEIVEAVDGESALQEFLCPLRCTVDGVLVVDDVNDYGSTQVVAQTIACSFEWAKTRVQRRRIQTLPDRLRSLPSNCFLCVLHHACATARTLLVRVAMLQTIATEGDLVRQVESSDGNEEAPQTDSRERGRCALWEDCVQRAAEKANECIARLVTFRSIQAARTTRAELARLIGTCNAFVTEAEVLLAPKTPCASLRSVVTQQAKAWVEHYHLSQITALTAMLENEKWTATPVAPELQALISSIARAAVDGRFDVDATDTVVDDHQNSVVVQVKMQANGFVTAAAVAASRDQPTTTRMYKIISTLLMLFRMLHGYLACLFDFRVEGLAPEITHRIVALLRQFNLRSSQLVLGAGAMQTAGLKSITAKHLALASQSVEVVAIHIPLVHTILNARLSARHRLLLAELERVESDYRKHTEQITAKLLSLAELVCSTACERSRGTDWASASEHGPSEYMVKLVKDVTMLHRILASVMQVTSSILHLSNYAE
jgi:vacuolar protein sorting-associated protein 54